VCRSGAAGGTTTGWRETIRLHPDGMPDHGLPCRQANTLADWQGGVWHPSWVRCYSCVIPVVGPLLPRPTTGYLLSTLRVDGDGESAALRGCPERPHYEPRLTYTREYLGLSVSIGGWSAWCRWNGLPWLSPSPTTEGKGYDDWAIQTT
jgi:hypothetical protein